MEFLDLTTLITIAIAVFILLRLRSVLGQRTGHQKPDDYFNQATKRSNNNDNEPVADNVVTLPQRNSGPQAEDKNPALEEIDAIAKPRTKLNKGMKDILATDPGFSPKEFLSGAQMAYEMIVNAFADGDKQTLRNLLSHSVFEGFEAVIDERAQRGETVKSSFVGIDSAEIRGAEMKGTDANVTLRFESQIVSATVDSTGKVVEGDENDVVRVTDIWTFSRDTRNRDPNWKLVATEAES